jgi:predicted N-acyltransferase
MMQITMVETVNEIQNKKKWDAYMDLFPGGNELKTDFLRVLENSLSCDFKFHYIEIYEEESLVFCSPIFIAKEVPLDLVVVSNRIQNIINVIKKINARLLCSKVIFVGTPLNDEMYFTTNQTTSFSKILDGLFKKLLELSKISHVNLIVFKNLINKSDFLFFKKRGFFETNSLPNSIINCDFESFDSYLKSLDSRKRRNVKYKLRKAEQVGYEIQILSTIEENKLKDFFLLFEKTYLKSELKFESPNLNLFRNLSVALQNKVIWISILIDNIPVASSYSYVEQDCLVMKRIGINYSSPLPYIYFILHYETIKYAINNKIKTIKLGPTSYQAKKEMGAYLQPTYLLMKHHNPFLNFLLYLFYFFSKNT